MMISSQMYAFALSSRSSSQSLAGPGGGAGLGSASESRAEGIGAMQNFSHSAFGTPEWSLSTHCPPRHSNSGGGGATAAPTASSTSNSKALLCWREVQEHKPGDRGQAQRLALRQLAAQHTHARSAPAQHPTASQP